MNSLKRIVYRLNVSGLLLVLSLSLSGCSVLPTRESSTSTENGFEVNSRMAEPVYDENGQVDQDAFEAQQTVEPNNDDLNTIEADLESTIILEEDFSNL